MSKTFVGSRVRQLRSERGFSQAALAQMLEISPSYLNQIENDQRPLTVQVLLKLGTLFDIDPTATLRLSANTTFTVGGTLEMQGTDFANPSRITSTDTVTPGALLFLMGALLTASLLGLAMAVLHKEK